MARPAKLPPTKPIGTNLSLEVLDAIDQAVAERQISKRMLFEIALRRELGLPEWPDITGDDNQEVLAFTA